MVEIKYQKKPKDIVFESDLKREEEIAKAMEQFKTEHIIVRSKVKELLKDCTVSKEFLDALEQEVKKLILRAKERARANKRNTLMARDI